MKNFKIGDKVIIDKEKDFQKFLKKFYSKELEVIDIKDIYIDNKTVLITFKSEIDNLIETGDVSFFKLSPQKGDRVKVLSKGTEDDVNLNYVGEYGTILGVSYLDKFPYFVQLDKTNAFDEKYEVFVEEVEMVDEIKSKRNKKAWVKEDFKNIHVEVTPEQSEKLQKYLFTLGIPWWQIGYEIINTEFKHLFVDEEYFITSSYNSNFCFSEKTILFEDIVFPDSELDMNIFEKLSLSDEAKYMSTEINNNYINEIMSTHYNNIDKLKNQFDNKPNHKPNDMVNHPEHYQSNKIEVIDIIDEFNLDFSLGNVIKYVLRSDKKGKQLEDLKKGLWYLSHKIKKLENEKNNSY